MTNQGAELSTITIVEGLFNFIKDNFDGFEHRKRKGEKNWWHNHKYYKNGQKQGKRGDSWSPFIQTWFMIEGGSLNYKIGECRTYPNLKDFMKSLNHPYGDESKKHPCRCYDISWVNQDGELILALEYEESANEGNGSTVDKQLYAISEELEKLRYYKGHFKILISRPRKQKRESSYSDTINYFEGEIKNKLSFVKPLTTENWILLLIAPDTDLDDHQRNANIVFHCYEWKTNKLEIIPLKENSFCVEMKNGGDIKRC